VLLQVTWLTVDVVALGEALVAVATAVAVVIAAGAGVAAVAAGAGRTRRRNGCLARSSVASYNRLGTKSATSLLVLLLMVL
jgi:hypothetical protein